MPLFDFDSAAQVTPGALKGGLQGLRELVPAGYGAQVRKALDFHADQMAPYLDAAIEATFSDPDVQDSVRSCAFTVPLTRKVIGRLSLLYKREPLRRLRPLGGASEEEVQRAERLYGEIAFQGGLSESLRAALELANLTNLALIQVAVSGERIVFDALSGADVLLAPPADGRVGDVADYEAVVLAKPYRLDGRRVFAFWSAALHFLFDEAGRIVDDFGDATLSNPFGVIPFVRIEKGLGGQLYPWPPESLICANERLNFAVTELFYTKKFQSFGQPVFVTDDDVRPDLKVGVQHLVHVVKRDAAAAGDFRFESPEAPIAQVKDSIFDFLRLTARLHDVSPQSVDLQAVVESGVSRMVSERDALETRERDVGLFRRAEDRVFEIAQALARYYAGADVGPALRFGQDLALLGSEGLGLQVDFAEAEPVLDPQARLALQERELALGLKNLTEVFRERNPDAASWSEEQILAAIVRNREMNGVSPQTNT